MRGGPVACRWSASLNKAALRTISSTRDRVCVPVCESCEISTFPVNSRRGRQIDAAVRAGGVAQAQRVAVDATAHAERVLANMPRFDADLQRRRPSKTVDTADRSLRLRWSAGCRRATRAHARTSRVPSILARCRRPTIWPMQHPRVGRRATSPRRRRRRGDRSATRRACAWQPERPEQKAKRERIARLLTRVVVGRREGDRDGARAGGGRGARPRRRAARRAGEPRRGRRRARAEARRVRVRV